MTKIRPIVRDAFKVDELVYQFTEIDVSDKLLVDGSLQEVSDNARYTNDCIVGEAEDRLAVVQENIDDLYDCSDTSLSVVCAPEFRWEADMKMYQRDKRQLTQFIKKWGDKS